MVVTVSVVSEGSVVTVVLLVIAEDIVSVDVEVDDVSVGTVGVIVVSVAGVVVDGLTADVMEVFSVDVFSLKGVVLNVVGVVDLDVNSEIVVSMLVLVVVCDSEQFALPVLQPSQ